MNSVFRFFFLQFMYDAAFRGKDHFQLDASHKREYSSVVTQEEILQGYDP